MNVTLEKNDDATGKIIVSIEENDYKEKVNKELKEIGRTHTIPGFRKGHVSVDQLRRRFGKEVKSEVINRTVIDAALDYIKENKINLLGELLPVEVKEINLNDKDYTFEYEIGFAPEINVELNKDITVPFYTIEVSKEMVDEQDQKLRERFGAQVPGDEVDAKALVKGAIMELNEDGTVKETEDAIQVVNGIVAPMYFTSKEEADKFIEKKVGDKVVFNPWNTCNGNAAELASMLQVDKSVAPNVKSDFQLAISEIIVLKPAVPGEELYKSVFGEGKVNNEEEYRQGIKAMIAQQLAPNSDMLFNMMAEKALVEKFGDIKLPDTFLKKWLVARNEGLTAENIDEEYAKMIPGIKWQLIKEQIASNADLKIEEADLLGFAKALAAQQFAQYGMTNVDEETVTDFAKRMLEDKKYRSRIVEQVGDRKLFNVIRAMVNVDSKEVSLDEFKKLANPGEEA